MLNTYIVSYATGMVPEISEFTIPVKASSKTEVEAQLDAATKFKQEIFAQIRGIDWTDDTTRLHREELTEKYGESVSICGRFFAGLDECDVLDFEILTMDEWINSFDVADAQEELRRKGACDA